MCQSSARLCVVALLAALLIPLTTPVAWCGSYEIGDADVVKTFKIDGLVTYERTGGIQVWRRPALSFGMGLTDTIELNMGSGYGIVSPRHGDHRSGIHDAFVALKWRLGDEDPSGRRPAFAIEPEVVLPTGNRHAGMSDGVTSLVLPARVSKHYGNVRLTWQVSYSHVLSRSEDVLSYGLLYEYVMSSQLSVGMEVLNDVPLHAAGNRHWHGNAGVRWNPVANIEVHGLLGRAWQPPGGDTSTIARMGVEYQFD